MTLLLLCLKIFFCIIINVLLGTIRLVVVVKGKNVMAALIAVCESLVWFLIVREAVLFDSSTLLEYWAIALSYAGGYAMGTLIGGICADNAASFLQMGASHVIVTSYVFVDGVIRYDRLDKLLQAVGSEHLVLDLSCRKKENTYYVVTDRWQKFTKQPLDRELLQKLSSYCDEFLVHAVNVEGTGTGVDEELISILAQETDIMMTYAGGIGSMEDIDKIRILGEGRVNFTVGSALDLFGGTLKFDKIVTKFR